MARYSPHAAPAPLSERVLLSLYDWRDPDERAAIKRCGAKWDPVLRAWWINYWDAVENPGIHRWVTEPMLADVLREANDFNNYGAAPPEKKKGRRLLESQMRRMSRTLRSGGPALRTLKTTTNTSRHLQKFTPRCQWI